VVALLRYGKTILCAPSSTRHPFQSAAIPLRWSRYILVRYDEKREGRKKIEPRAYWLRGDGEPDSNPYKPHSCR
jgi:hypothetical protein